MTDNTNDTQPDISELGRVIRDAVNRRGGQFALRNKSDEKFLNDVLAYLHGVSLAGVNRFERLGKSVWTEWEETGQLRIICEVVSDLSQHVDRTRLAGLVVAVDLMETRREQFHAKSKATSVRSNARTVQLASAAH